MSVPSYVVRELGAEIRQFNSVRQCVLWYVEKKLRRMGMRGFDMESIGKNPAPPMTRDVAVATYAAVSRCIESQHMECDVHDETKIGPYIERVVHLATWYQMSVERGEQFLADRLDMTPRTLAGYCEMTESIIRRRLRARGLIAERPR